jgi:hypothetical protein
MAVLIDVHLQHDDPARTGLKFSMKELRSKPDSMTIFAKWQKGQRISRGVAGCD